MKTYPLQKIFSKTLQTLLDIEMFMDVESVTSVLELGCGNGWLSNPYIA